MPLDSKSPKETMITEKSLYIRAIFLLFIPIIYKEMILFILFMLFEKYISSDNEKYSEFFE